MSSGSAADKIESNQEELQANVHRIDSLNLLLFTGLLVTVVLTIWAFKRRNFRYIHETCLALIYGFIIGAIIRYTNTSKSKHMKFSLPMNTTFQSKTIPNTIYFEDQNTSAIYLYSFKGPYQKDTLPTNEERAIFDAEIFFNIILPPIIFHAGYSMKRRHFFRNLGAILIFALLGTTIACVLTGSIIYGAVHFFKDLNYFSFTDSLYFGAIISATDPVTVLAIFNDLNVDVDLYAIIFGESVLNDAVCLVLASSIDKYAAGAVVGKFDQAVMLKSLGHFFFVFIGSFAIGSGMGCLTALMTKFTYIRDFPLLETALFLLMSYSTFLASEAAGLTGIVAVLFCGIFQAHYTYNNLSSDSKQRTRDLFDLFSFLAENFIFVYIGVTMFTFRNHRWDVKFIIPAIIAIAVARIVIVVLLSFLLNFTRKKSISWRWQFIIIFAGLRGAVAFALAIRNVSTGARSLMYTTTSVIVILTVMFNGTLTAPVLRWLKIRMNVTDESEQLPSLEGTEQYRVSNNSRSSENDIALLSDMDNDSSFVNLLDQEMSNNEQTLRQPPLTSQSWLFNTWSHFDRMFVVIFILLTKDFFYISHVFFSL
ncbi:unnamed protein product [Didymodactylos carnosus]|uniref:Sodium/hydrogen exchanger n=1 Tax=Didymodactylos carnosus TaxID=1234261 RepID=A0A815BSY9_9BILA|nr:unnamed protein product [Didymodactylos carnosus]CAF4065290.1 unnamed protein product [Didymodactylos carnosus]